MIKMITRIGLCLLALGCATTPLMADQREQHRINQEMEAALDRDPSTAGMCRTFVTARDQWEKEIINSFVTLKQRMDPEEFEALRRSQKAWEQYRDVEVKTQGELFSRQEGTMWRPTAAAAEMDLYRNRAMVLAQYVTAVSDRNPAE